MVRSVQQIKYADSFLPEEAVFAGGCKEKRIPIVLSFYLLQTDTRTVLVDAGCDDLPGFVMLERFSPVEALHRHGVSPEQVTDIIITHAHHDHIDGVRYFPNACVYLQRDEYAAGKQYLSDRVQVITFAQEQTVDDCLHIVRIGGHSKGSCVVEFASLQGTSATVPKISSVGSPPQPASTRKKVKRLLIAMQAVIIGSTYYIKKLA